ncbi:MAG: ATP-grasp domain-containing protein [Ignavibacteriae bacterium]|nr:ATP-grasp domain-containing protein [Ignavibacteriota bacterium]
MDETSEPPSLSYSETQTKSFRTTLRSFVQSFTDLYAEWDTFETIDAVRAALAEFHHLILIEADEDVYARLSYERPDIVFNMAEGLHGAFREAQIPAILEMLKIPYTGSDPLTLAICLNKARTKEILTFHHIPTPQFSVISNLSETGHVSTLFPCIVKPLHEGSSKGIFNSSLVNTNTELKQTVISVIEKYDEPALVEEYLPGREFTVAILGNGDNLTVLPIVEIKFDSLPVGVNPIYSFEAKWIWDHAEAPLDIFECPAQISSELQHEIERICRKAFTVLRCRDWCRIDVRLDAQGRPHILELNPLPGILPKPEDNSCFPKAARAAGISYNQLIQSVLALAAQRYGFPTQAAVQTDAANECSFIHQLKDTA